LAYLGVDGRITLTLTLLKWRIGSAPNNASKWQMGFNSAFKGLKCILKKLDGRPWTGLILLRIGACDGLLWIP
jgi:hypothetical protein